MMVKRVRRPRARVITPPLIPFHPTPSHSLSQSHSSPSPTSPPCAYRHDIDTTSRQASQLAGAPGSWEAAQAYYDQREVRLVGPKELGPTQYTSDYPPKQHPEFRAVPPYVQPPMVPLGDTTSYNVEFPPKVDDKRTRVPDRSYRELNPPEPVPSGSTTHAQFPGHMPSDG